jgi:hypothetical protein
MPISTDDVEALRSILASLPRNQPKQVSKQEAIASLVSELGAAQRRGYSADDLARLMSEKGIEVNGPTLRNCLRRLRKKRRPHDKTRAREASADSTPVASPAPVADRGTPGSAAVTDTPKAPPTPPAREVGAIKPEPRLAPSSTPGGPHR